MNIVDFFDRGAALFPDRPFLIAGERITTYRQARARSCQIAHALLARGPGSGANVAIYSANDDRALICLLGVLRAGCRWVAVNAGGRAEMNIEAIRRADTAAIVFNSAYEEPIFRAGSARLDLRHAVCIDRPSAYGAFLDDWIAGHPSEPPRVRPAPGDTCGIFPAEGPSGTQRAVVHTHSAMETKIASFMIHMPPRKPPVFLLATPWTHAAGSVVQALLAHGVTIVVLPTFEPPAFLEAIERYRPTYLFLPPRAIYSLLAQPQVRRFDYSSLEYFLYAAAPMSADKLALAMSVFGPVMAQSYGQVEAPAICTFFSPQEHLAALKAGDLQRLRSCGRASALTQVEIMGDDGALMPPGSVGEVVVRGNLVTQGYYQDDAATRAASTADGWHRTGDVGSRDENGFISIIGRKRDVIVSGDGRVHPAEIERAILAHPGVQDCAVVGLPDRRRGEAACAVVQPMPGTHVTEEELLDLCRSRLGAAKAPVSVAFWEELPRSEAGRVDRRAVRERLLREANEPWGRPHATHDGAVPSQRGDRVLPSVLHSGSEAACRRQTTTHL